MSVDFSELFAEYRALVDEVDTVFQKIKEEHGDCVKCEIGCSDCCYALFDLTLVEALYLKHHFEKDLDGDTRDRIRQEANTADRQVYKIKRKAFKEQEEGRPIEEILEEVAKERIRCPLLNDENRCRLYEHRPITCRLYGIPTAMGGKSHTCFRSGFEPGQAYPTVNLDLVHKRLLDMSRAFVDSLDTKHVKLAEVLVPVSMALLTEYDEEYLGLKK